jgi:hypothetical protein
MDQLTLTHVDVPEIREIFADTVRAVNVHDGVPRIELALCRIDEPHPPAPLTGKTFTVARLALSPSAAIALCANLTNALNMMEQEGMLKRVAAVQPPGAPPKH